MSLSPSDLPGLHSKLQATYHYLVRPFSKMGKKKIPKGARDIAQHLRESVLPGTQVLFQYSHVSPQLSITLLAGEPVPSSDH